MDRDPRRTVNSIVKVFQSPKNIFTSFEIWKKTKEKEYLKLHPKKKRMEIKVDKTATTLLYILSFFIPFAGFIVGAIYLSKDEEHYKHIGKNCLIFSVLNIVLLIILAIAAGA